MINFPIWHVYNSIKQLIRNQVLNESNVGKIGYGYNIVN